MHWRMLAVLFGAMTWAVTASAAPIVYTSETRSLEAYYRVLDPFTFQTSSYSSLSDAPDAPFADFTSEFEALPNAHAYHHSTFSPLEFVVELQTSLGIGDSVLESGSAYSSFLVEFDVLAPVEIQITGTTESGPYPSRVTLYRGNFRNSLYSESPTTHDFTEVLTPGSYGFRVDSNDSGAVSVTTRFTAVVPEPGTAMLLGIGFASIGMAGRRRRRWHSA